MRIKIKRGKKQEEFEVSSNLMLLEALFEIKHLQDSSLTFDSGCKSMVCGACSVRVNGKEVLACGTKVNENDLIEPLSYHLVIRDLKVNKSLTLTTIKKEKAFINEYNEVVLTLEDENKTALQSDCILCNSCYSACPVMEVNSNFLGPFALTKAYRYVIDKRLKEPKNIIDNIQKDGIWDCTLCGECTLVCPKKIDPKNNIINLRNISAAYGFIDPNLTNINFGNGFNF